MAGLEKFRTRRGLLDKDTECTSRNLNMLFDLTFLIFRSSIRYNTREKEGEWLMAGQGAVPGTAILTSELVAGQCQASSCYSNYPDYVDDYSDYGDSGYEDDPSIPEYPDVFIDP